MHWPLLLVDPGQQLEIPHSDFTGKGPAGAMSERHMLKIITAGPVCMETPQNLETGAFLSSQTTLNLNSRRK